MDYSQGLMDLWVMEIFLDLFWHDSFRINTGQVYDDLYHPGLYGPTDGWMGAIKCIISTALLSIINLISDLLSINHVKIIPHESQ